MTVRDDIRDFGNAYILITEGASKADAMTPEVLDAFADAAIRSYDYAQGDFNPRRVVVNGDGSTTVVLPVDEAKALGLYERKAGLHGLDMNKVREFYRAGLEPVSGPEQQPDGSWAVRVGTIPRAIKASAVTSTPTDGLRGEERRLMHIGSKAARFRF